MVALAFWLAVVLVVLISGWSAVASVSVLWVIWSGLSSPTFMIMGTTGMRPLRLMDCGCLSESIFCFTGLRFYLGVKAGVGFRVEC